MHIEIVKKNMFFFLITYILHHVSDNCLNNGMTKPLVIIFKIIKQCLHIPASSVDNIVLE